MTIKCTSLISSNFLNDIKSQTINSHKKLENLSISGSILSPEMKIQDYVHYLSVMHDVHKNTEEVIFSLLSATIDDLEKRKKSHLIENDFFFLNHSKPNSKVVFDATQISVPFALGILYVIEGSSLGGRFIVKNITTIPGLDNGHGISYFNGYGEKTGSYWKSFLNLLVEYEQNYKCGDTIIEGAVYAFESIYNHFRSQEKK
ncbi:biliverdin-producing heme oxygenase [Flavobacterium sp.]|uniref:biliverdin-producing heme oxygenase n=1 Tax=Flavobacterium sp. TaxID=239 RepID=UPI0032639612